MLLITSPLEKPVCCFFSFFVHLSFFLFIFSLFISFQKKEGEKYEFVEELNLPSYELQDYYYDKEKFVVCFLFPNQTPLHPLLPSSPSHLPLLPQLALDKKKNDIFKKKEKDEPQPVALFSEMKENWMIDIGTWTVRTISVTDRN